MNDRVAEAVGRVTEQKVPDELTRRVHDANARFHDVRRRLDDVQAGDAEQGHQGRLDVLAAELREAEKAVEAADQAVHDHIARPIATDPHSN